MLENIFSTAGTLWNIVSWVSGADSAKGFIALFKKTEHATIESIRKKSEEAYNRYCNSAVNTDSLGIPDENKVIGYWESCMERCVLPSCEDLQKQILASKEEAESLLRCLTEEWMNVPEFVSWMIQVCDSEKLKEMGNKLQEIAEAQALSASDIADIKKVLQNIEMLGEKETDHSLPHLLSSSPQKVDSDVYIHRETEEEKIRDYISSSSKGILIYGIGGIGKTTVARSLYHQLKDDFPYVAWVEYNNTLKESLLIHLNLYENEQNQEIRYKMIENFVNDHNDLLLFVDNVEKDYAGDSSLKLLSSTDAKVVITSRMISMDHFQSYQIEKMSIEFCIDVFYRYYPFDEERRQKDVVKDLVILVAQHTLSVELLAKAANVIEYRDLSIFLADLKKEGFGYPDRPFSTDHTQDEKTMAEHLVVLFNMVKLDAEQQRILKNFAVMPSIVIPPQIKKWMDGKTKDFERIIKLGWIQQTEEGYMMLDIVRKSINLQAEITLQDCYRMILYIGNNTLFDKSEPYSIYSTKLQIVAAYAEKFRNVESLDCSNLYCETANAYFHHGDYAEALEWYEKALVICEKILGMEHPSTATIYNNVASVYDNQGEYAKALEWYEKALVICEKILGMEHPDTATTYNNIASVYDNQGEYNKALEWHEKALVIREKILGMEHPDTATTYNNIAGVYDNQGEYDKALEWYEKALVIREKILGVEHPSTAATYNNIASVYDNQGEYAKALEWYEKALVILEKVLGMAHPNTIIVRKNKEYILSKMFD